ncbi:FIP1[V]-like protein [Euphorbia lathyris]|uniref:FIP1[V]-like protein n=1 Tax=Euphorbia lathyris TaxID=212925 RepID=UPI00331356AC
MGDLMDDDFGDIYADVEFQASSAINSVSKLDKLYTEPQEGGEGKGEECKYDNNAKQVKARANEENPRLLNSVCEKSSNTEEYVSDSEDDFNIVLNDEDCKGFSVAAERNGNRSGLEEDVDEGACVKNGYDKNGLNPSANGHGGEQRNGVNDSYNSQYQQKLKQFRSLFPNNQVNESVGVASCSSKSVRGAWEDDRYKQHEVSNTSQLPSIRSATNFVASHGGYGFSLPWNRTILDVNIDAFEEKRWRYPGVDISDFFNFGFDEDSWKQYCISLEQLRQQLYLHKRFHNHDFSHLTEASDVRPESGTAPEGIAQAGSSSKFADIGKRLLGLPKGRAIQVEDGSGERQSKMDVRRPRTWDSDVVIQINVQDPGEICSGSSEDKFDHVEDVGLGASTVRNLNVDDTKDDKDCDSSSADESLGDVRSSSMKGFPLPVAESNKMNLAPDNPDKNHKVNAQTSKGIAEATETVEKVEEENGRTICKPDQQLTEIEVSVGDRSHFSLTLSCSESESESSQDTVYNLPEASHRLLSRQSSGAKLLESDASDCKSPKSNVVKKKQDNRQHFSRRRSPIWEGRRQQNRRLHNVSQGKTHPDIDSYAFPMYRDNLSIDKCRQMERLNDFGYHNRHDFSCDQRREFSGIYSDEKFAEVHTQDLHGKYPHLRYNQSFRNEVEPCQRRNWTEENFHERRIWLDDRDGLSKDWDSGERVLSPRGMSSLTYGQSRRFHSKYKNLNDTNIQRRRKRDRIESGKQTNDDVFLLDHKNEDYAMLHKYGRSVMFNSEKESFNEKYEKHVPSVGREAYLRERRDRYGYRPPMNLENSWCMEIEDEHWDLDDHNVSYWPHRESYAANNGRLRNKMSPRSDICDPRLPDRYGQELDSERFRESDFVENYNDYDNVEGDIVYTDDQAYRGWKKYSWKSRVLHQVECESILKQQDNISYRSSGSYENTFRHERFQSNYRSTNGYTASVIQSEGHRYKIFEGETNASFPSRKPHMTYRGEHDRTACRYNSPVGLIYGEGKSSGRRLGAARSMANGKHELMDQKFVKEQKVLRDFSGTQTRRATQCSIAKLDGGKDGKLQDKFPVTARNGDFDIEEGQIVAEELIKEERLEIKSVALKQNMKKRLHCENVNTGNATDKGYDEQRIQDTLAKMERRRQRFQDPIGSKKEPDSVLTDLIADTVGKKQERPARKRQWGGR